LGFGNLSCGFAFEAGMAPGRLDLHALLLKIFLIVDFDVAAVFAIKRDNFVASHVAEF